MDYREAMLMAEDLLTRVAPACEEIVIAGSLRRRKPADIHDIEFVLKPKLGRPSPQFGQKVVHTTYLDKLLYEMADEGRLARVKGGQRYKQYTIQTQLYGIQEPLNPFNVEFYIILPPSQWGVGLVIRTGPGSSQDNFSRWCVTHVHAGGRLPEGYRVKHLGVWRSEQLDERDEPLEGQAPVDMPTEESFLDFLGLGWIEPWDRHAHWPPRRA